MTKLILLLVLVLGLLAGVWLERAVISSQGPQLVPADLTPPGGGQSDRLQTLQQQLLRSEQERARLGERVALLEAMLAETGTPDQDPATPDQDAATPGKVEVTSTSAHDYRTSTEVLMAAGIPEAMVAEIRAHLDFWELERLNLQDRAKREGWMGSARYREKTRELLQAHESLRPELGDEYYDRLLYAIGRANRVQVRDVIQSSSAEQVGLQPGDRIIEYGGQRVFSTAELSNLTGQGSAGVAVLCRVERGGEQLDFYLPRGPIGVRMAPVRVPP